jgi:iron(III) transport system substrate-binding protein
VGRIWLAAALPALVAALALLALAGCSATGSGGGDALTLYNGQHVQTTDALVKAFEEATGIRVAVRSNDEDTLADEIVTEGGNSPADVIYTENSPALEYLQERGLLAPVDPATLNEVPAKFSSPRGQWVGVSARVSVMIYNPALISAAELPKSVLEMANPRYNSKLAIAPGETDFQPIVTSVEKAVGKARTLKWLEGLKANAGAHVYPDNETITSQVNSGAVAFGVINQYYWYRLGAEIGKGSIHSKLAYFTPHDPGYVLDVSGAAVLRSSARKSQAERFLAFLVSEKGQEIIAHSLSFEYPIAHGIEPAAAAETPFAQLQPYPITIAQLGDGSNAIGLMREAGLL